MIESEEYKKCKEEYQRELDKFNRDIIKKRTKKYLIIGFFALLFCVLLCVPSYILDFGKMSIFVRNTSERLLFPVIVAIVTTYIIADIKSKK